MFKDLRLKAEAAKQRKSLATIIRRKLASEKYTTDQSQVNKLLHELDTAAKKNAKKLKDWNSLDALHEIRQS